MRRALRSPKRFSSWGIMIDYASMISDQANRRNGATITLATVDGVNQLADRIAAEVERVYGEFAAEAATARAERDEAMSFLVEQYEYWQSVRQDHGEHIMILRGGRLEYIGGVLKKFDIPLPE